MGRTAEPRSTGGVYAPLLGERVAVSVLYVGRFDGRRVKPVKDAGGEQITVPVEAGMSELRSRISEPGRYRVSARDVETNDCLSFSEYRLKPLDASEHEPERRSDPVRELEPEPDDEWEESEPMPERRTRSKPWRGEVSEHAYVGHLHETINDLRDQLRESASRAERDVRYERERAESGVKAAQERADAQLKAEKDKAAEETRSLREKCEAASKLASDAQIKLSAYVARLDASERRADMLEAQLAEMKEEVENARELAVQLKAKAEDGGFSPIDAFMQMDQALDVIGKTAERFKGD